MQRRRWIRIRSFRAALLLFLPVAVTVAALVGRTSDGAAQQKVSRAADRDLALFADPVALLDGNEFRCGIDNLGSICRQAFTTSFGGGGFWPGGAPNQYVFNSGFQVAGIVGPDGGPWAGDTTGAFFFELRGTQPAATPLTGVYDSADPEDLAAWPPDARILDEELFRSEDVGRAVLSGQDTWVQYWEGDPARIAGRPHPLGVRVTQRSLQWTYPSGSESVIYFLVDLTNVTAEDAFRTLNQAEFFAGEEALPEEGYSLEDLYFNATADLDVSSNAGENLSTAFLPFDMVASYHGRFSAPGFEYHPQLHYPPFFPTAPGIVGIKYLRTPADPATGKELGLTLWTSYSGSSTAFPSPDGPEQLLRYMTGRLDPAQGDFPCNVVPEIDGGTGETIRRSQCTIYQTPLDARFMMATGPFELAPGETETIAVAYVVAPTLATLPDGTPTGVAANTSDHFANLPGLPSWHPGFPSARGCTDASATTCSQVDPANPVTPLERGAGWVSYDGPAPTSALDAPEHALDPARVETAPHSLLDRALVAQTIFDAKFLRPMPPEPPAFYLLPGDEAVTIVWEQSPTTVEGDPYFALAGDPTSVLYNPNYRESDVVGYEIWRGTSPEDLEVVAVYGEERPYLDRTCETVPLTQDLGLGSGPGYSIGEPCPEDFAQELTAFDLFFGRAGFNNGVPGGRPGRGVVRSASGTTTFVSELRPFPLPQWQDVFARVGPVPFIHRDTALANNFTYYYDVTAVDLNSPASGPPTLRSEPGPRSVIPRAESGSLSAAEITFTIEGGRGEPLVAGEPPEIDPEDGTFDGPFPPTEGIALSFARLVPQLLPDLDLEAHIDSVKPDWARQEGCTVGPISFQSTCWRMYLTVDGEPTEAAGLASNWSALGRPAVGTTETAFHVANVEYDREALDAFGIPSLAASATATLHLDESINFSNWEGQQNRREATRFSLHGGVRWFSGAEETTPDPARYIRVGRLAGVDSVWAPIHHTPTGPGEPELPNSATVQWFGYLLAHLGRSADLEVRWRGGTVTVRDVTHGVDVPFSADYGSSWGFLNEDCDGSGAVDWVDFFCVGEGRTFWESLAIGGTRTLSPASLSSRPSLGSIALDTNLPQGPTHTGFALYLNGMRHFFVTDRIPDDGTVWTLRAYHGVVTTAFDRTDVADPGGYEWRDRYDQAEGIGSPLIPGLTLRWRVEAGEAGFPSSADLAAIHTVPDPYLLYSAYDGGGRAKELVLVNLPPRATVRIYTLGGILVDVIDHDDPTGGGRAPWDLRNRGGQFVASGVYFWHVVTPEGEERVGKFTIVNPDRN